MAREIFPYQPDWDLIKEQSSIPQPVMVHPDEYDDFLAKNGLHRGDLSDVGILKAMELGLIKIWADDERFDLKKQIQSNNVDLRLGNEFWFYRPHRISRLTLGEEQVMEELDLLEYAFKVDGDEFVFHPNALVLALTREMVANSNVVIAKFDGKSKPARYGISNHQTAGLIHSGFCGNIMQEFSNCNDLDVAVPIGREIASVQFSLITEPSSRPRNLDPDRGWTHFQTGPFGFRKPEWDLERDRVLKAGLPQKNGYHLTGDGADLIRSGSI